VFETPDEIAALQTLLDSSRSRSTGHLQSIVSDERALSAAQLVRVATGMCTLALSTVTRAGEPRVSGVDGHLLHGHWIFGTDPSAAKARHLAARPSVSVAHLRGDDLGIFTHGRAVRTHDPETFDYLKGHYGAEAFVWDEVNFYRIEPTWMVAYAPDPVSLAGADAG
jgi:hypothetical protein